ncbi:MAG: hypothetical protein WCP69_15355 [Bacteroidota bacterium]
MVTKNNNIKIGLIVAVVIIVAFLFFYLTILFQQNIEKKHPRIAYNGSVFGKVKKVWVNIGVVNFNLYNLKQFSTVDSRNYDYSPEFIDEFIINGDSIYKPKNSDTLYVFRDNNKYFFILGKFINKKNK